jgi:hypothetical protein
MTASPLASVFFVSATVPSGKATETVAPGTGLSFSTTTTDQFPIIAREGAGVRHREDIPRIAQTVVLFIVAFILLE